MRALFLLVLLAQSASAQDLPTFDTGGVFAYFGTLCDCDEGDYVFLTRDALDGHAEPRTDSPLVRVVAPNRLIEGNDWDIVITVVPAPDTGVLNERLRLRSARRMPDPSRGAYGTGLELDNVSIPAGTRVTVYSNYAWEGYVRYGDTTYFGGIPLEGDATWDAPSTTSLPEATWYRLLPRRGAPAAWVEIRLGDEANVEMLCGTHTACADGFTPNYRPDRR